MKPFRPPRMSVAKVPMRTTSRADDHETIFGLRAGLAVFGRRRDDLMRVSFAPELRHELSDLLRWATARNLPVQALSSERLAQEAGSPHHEGLCVLAKPRRWVPAASLVDRLTGQGHGVCVALDRVRNPYNVGAILRSTAFFGVDVALLGAPAPHPALPADAVRVAEGAVEAIALSRTTDLADTLRRFRARGVRVVGADGHATVSALGFAFTRPCVLVLGHEREGLSERVRGQCDALVSIPGSGAVESLNVAVAAGVLLCEMMRAR